MTTVRTVYRQRKQIAIVDVDRDLTVKDDDVLIRGQLCGFCKSDVETIIGFNHISAEMFGHEGVGVIEQVGASVFQYKKGDVVATWGDGCYGDYYVQSQTKISKVRGTYSQYIVQPLATMVNVASYIPKSTQYILVIGSGSNAILLAKYLKHKRISFECFGSHNTTSLWMNGGMVVKFPKDNFYDVVVEVSGKQGAYQKAIKYVKEGGIIIGGANPPRKELVDLFAYSWKAVHVEFPSPRSKHFSTQFQMSADLLNTGRITISDVFQKGYSRSDPEQLKQALKDRINYKVIKSYLYW